MRFQGRTEDKCASDHNEPYEKKGGGGGDARSNSRLLREKLISVLSCNSLIKSKRSSRVICDAAKKPIDLGALGGLRGKKKERFLR